jgi:hypothetical protein
MHSLVHGPPLLATPHCTLGEQNERNASSTTAHTNATPDSVANAGGDRADDEPWQMSQWAGTPSSGCSFRTRHMPAGGDGLGSSSGSGGVTTQASAPSNRTATTTSLRPVSDEPWEWKFVPPPSSGCGYRGPSTPPAAAVTNVALHKAPSTLPLSATDVRSAEAAAAAEGDGDGAIEQCDDDTLSHMFSHLDARSLLRCARVCTRWHAQITSHEDATWQTLCRLQWPWPWDKTTPTWRGEHRRRTLLDRAWASRDGQVYPFSSPTPVFCTCARSRNFVDTHTHAHTHTHTHTHTRTHAHIRTHTTTDTKYLHVKRVTPNLFSALTLTARVRPPSAAAAQH